MKEQDKQAINALGMGGFAFVHQGRVVFLDIERKDEGRCFTRVKFSIAKLGQNEEKIVLGDQSSDGANSSNAISGLCREYGNIVVEYARERFLQDGRVENVVGATVVRNNLLAQRLAS